MKTALIMGINGSFGGYVAQALVAEGWQLKVLIRDVTKLPKRFKGADIVQGDASCIDDVRTAMKGAEIVVYGISPANYDWENTALPWLDITATVAEEKGLKLIFPGNVYVFNPADSVNFNEDSRIAPICSKGKIRKAMEERLKVASTNGVKVVIIRCGDFLGKEVKSSWLFHLVKPGKTDVKLLNTGPVELKHSYAYLPDVAQVITEIVSKFDKLAAFNVFHFKGNQVNFNDLANAIFEVSGKKVSIKKFPWLALKFMSLFSKRYAGLMEMRYLWQVEINLESKKLDKFLGHECTITPINEVLTECEILSKID